MVLLFGPLIYDVLMACSVTTTRRYCFAKWPKLVNALLFVYNYNSFLIKIYIIIFANNIIKYNTCEYITTPITVLTGRY